jgi:hypothetical protein
MLKVVKMPALLVTPRLMEPRKPLMPKPRPRMKPSRPPIM